MVTSWSDLPDVNAATAPEDGVRRRMHRGDYLQQCKVRWPVAVCGKKNKERASAPPAIEGSSAPTGRGKINFLITNRSQSFQVARVPSSLCYPHSCLSRLRVSSSKSMVFPSLPRCVVFDDAHVLPSRADSSDTLQHNTPPQQDSLRTARIPSRRHRQASLGPLALPQTLTTPFQHSSIWDKFLSISRIQVACSGSTVYALHNTLPLRPIQPRSFARHNIIPYLNLYRTSCRRHRI